jgi:hypothetical protein
MGDPGSKQNALLDILLNPSAEAEELSFSLLENITENFSDELIIGRGGFGAVYKVCLITPSLLRHIHLPTPCVVIQTKTAASHNRESFKLG